MRSSPVIADLQLRIPSGLAADAEDAAAEIARFDASAEHGLDALTAGLLHSESASSSQIEQITASAGAIAEAEPTGSRSANAVVVDNMNAMTDAVARADGLTVDRIAEMQRALLERQSPRMVGWRDEPVWIGGGGSTPGTADYVAPDHRRISLPIDDLVRFCKRDDLLLLPQIAVAHAQFETIHPFADGNGRTGRALVQVLLLPAHPVIDAETVAREIGINPANVRRSVGPLADAGVLVSSQHDKSHKLLYRAPAILQLLDEYAAEVGHRAR